MIDGRKVPYTCMLAGDDWMMGVAAQRKALLLLLPLLFCWGGW